MAADFGPRDAMCGSLNRQDEDSWVSRCYDWCLERGYEYVEVCTADDGVDASLTLFGDRQGCGRIVEALHCHRWPGAELRPLPGAAEVRGEDEEEREQEDFEDLLATVASARAEGASLPDDQRRKNAEAMLFSASQEPTFFRSYLGIFVDTVAHFFLKASIDIEGSHHTAIKFEGD